MSRVVTALVLLPLVLTAIFTLSGWWFLLFVLLVVEIAVWEYATLATRLGARRAVFGLLVLVPIGVLFLHGELVDGTGMRAADLTGFGALIVLGSGVAALWSRRRSEEVVATLGLTSFGIVYFSVPIAALAALHDLDPWYVVLGLAIVWAGDSAAYCVGTLWGRHLLAPRVSPKKTWEGAAAGFAAALAVGASWSVLRGGSAAGSVMVAAAAAGVAGQLGDLVESLLKRRAGVKDSGALLPGHGGMLDRLDSLLLAVPVLCVALWLLGGEHVQP